MKNFKTVLSICIVALIQVSINAQEKKIKFSKGTLRICSSKNFQITGYDGSEVVIKSLHEKKTKGNFYVSNLKGQVATTQGSTLTTTVKGARNSKNNNSIVYYFGDQNRKKGLKKLGKNNENLELGIYFTIEQNNGELIFKDKVQPSGQFVMYGNESYEIKIPNSLKLTWETNGCVLNSSSSQSAPTALFYNSNPSSLSNFNGEVEMQSTLSNIKLKDVTGPVSINTVGGNVTIEFDKKTPQKLYSIYSNNGFIDITLPTKSGVAIDASARNIYSDIDFKIEEEKEDNQFHHMRLKLNTGRSKMKLNAGLGNVYLRKKS
ncbi:hypothetical protein AAON49_00970 [Pseudotenacibaculum sp. MALMAid0570]|uniref:hypothetical protein n=1 Tax=Pseudotenacibaculum sp. MALMAid0570 TaxID=3143938 RepID=UPI0032E01766